MGMLSFLVLAEHEAKEKAKAEAARCENERAAEEERLLREKRESAESEEVTTTTPGEDPEEKDGKPDYSALKRDRLLDLAKERGHEGVSQLKKDELIALLEKDDAGGDPKDEDGDEATT